MRDLIRRLAKLEEAVRERDAAIIRAVALKEDEIMMANHKHEYRFYYKELKGVSVANGVRCECGKELFLDEIEELLNGG